MYPTLCNFFVSTFPNLTISTHPQVTLNNSTLPLENTPCILGVTLDSHFEFNADVKSLVTQASIFSQLPQGPYWYQPESVKGNHTYHLPISKSQKNKHHQRGVTPKHKSVATYPRRVAPKHISVGAYLRGVVPKTLISCYFVKGAAPKHKSVGTYQRGSPQNTNWLVLKILKPLKH